MRHIHEVAGFATLGANAVAAAWGAFVWTRAIPSRVFWYLLRIAQAMVVIEIVLGFVRLAQGDKPSDELHYVYAVAPLIVALVTEGMRAGASQRELELVDGDPDALPRRERILLARRIVMREIGIMTVGLILVTTLLIRAAQSG